MKKRYSALLILAVIAALLLAGCGKAKESPDVSGCYIRTFEEEYEGNTVEVTQVVELNSDHTCEVTLQDTVTGTYTDNTISLEDGSKYEFSVSGDALTLKADGTELSFTKGERPAPVVESETETVTNDTPSVFSTTDIDGNAVSFGDFSDAKLIMINFWEPWCGPCVREMPDLEKLYEEYKADGLVILGVFSTEDMEDEAREVLDSCGTSYPILRYTDEMEAFVTEYVPTTVFLDGQGNLLTDEPIVGSNSFDGWKQVVEEYLNR